MAEMKKVSEVFNDFEEKNNIMKAKIANITISKKTGELKIHIQSELKIQTGEILSFEMYLKNRFNVVKSTINIDYIDDNKNVENKEENILKSEEEPKELNSIIIGT